MERRLAAIMAADVVGYSRLIRADEEGTITALKILRADLVDPTLAEHNGRIVKLMGDGMLAEFPSVVDAVRAAVETQQAVAEHNATLPEDKRIEFRVGINLGDVVTWIVARLCLVLPAKALSSRVVTLASVWQMTHGQERF